VKLSRLWSSFEPHREAGRLIVVEGSPGAGKTSAIVSVGRATGSVVVPELYHLTDASVPSEELPDHSAHWYIDAELARQGDIRRCLKAGLRVIQDRSVVSTLAFAHATAIDRRSCQRAERLIQRLVDGPKFLAPDTLVIMHVDVVVGLRRRRAFRQVAEYRQWFDEAFLHRLNTFYRVVVPQLLRCPMVEIDTSCEPPTVANEALTRVVVTLNGSCRGGTDAAQRKS
jgi:thymidylate kinase